MRLEEAEAPFIGGGRGHEPVLGHHRGSEAADTGPARMEALGPRAILEEFEAARVRRQRDALRVDQLRGIEPVQLAGRERAGKDADYTCGVEPDLVKSPFGHRAESRARLYAGDIRRQQVAARKAKLRGKSHCCGQHAGCEVRDCFAVRVVVIEAVHEDAVGEHRVTQRQALRMADHAAGAGSAKLSDGPQRDRCEIEPPCGERAAYGVEHQVLGARAHLCRDRLPAQRDSESGKGLGDRHSTLAPDSLMTLPHFTISLFM